jgi:TPR repeat protein
MIDSRAWLNINLSVDGILRSLITRNVVILGPVLFFFVLGLAIADEHGASEISKLQTLAEQGDTTAQVHLGMRYQQGRGLPQDFKLAYYWYSKAANKGHDVAQRNLGLMYYQARGISQDFQQARYWFNRSAELGNSDAQRYLGIMHKNGDGVSRDPVTAQMWFIISAATGNKFGISYRERMAKTMTQAQTDKAQQLANDWMARHRQQ